MSKRLLILDTSSNCLDMTLRAKMAGWSCKWYDKPRADGGPRLAGTGMIDKITTSPISSASGWTGPT